MTEKESSQGEQGGMNRMRERRRMDWEKGMGIFIKINMETAYVRVYLFLWFRVFLIISVMFQRYFSVIRC